MYRLLAVLVFMVCASLRGQLPRSAVSVADGAPSDSPSTRVVAGGWTPMPVPASLAGPFVRGPGFGIHRGTGDLYVHVVSGDVANCSLVSVIYRADAATHTWQNISGTGLPSGCFQVHGLLPLPNGSVLAIVINRDTHKKILNDTLYGWNGNVNAPVWKHITGGPGQGSNADATVKIISSNSYFTRGDGITCFAIDVIFCNSTPNGLSFSAMTNAGTSHDGSVGRGLYFGTQRGAVGNTGNGFVYPMDDFDSGDGRGEQAWACGEGDALEFSPYHISTLYKDFVAFVPNNGQGTGWTSNCLAIAHGPSSVMIIRGTAAKSPYPGADMTHISLPSMVVKVIPPSAGYVPYPGSQIGALYFVGGVGVGSRWIRVASNSSAIRYYYSADDGTSWTDIAPALLAADPACAANSLSLNVVTDGRVLYSHCTDAATKLVRYWTYAP